jgi:N12 class adenine-specific DNA methylase
VRKNFEGIILLETHLKLICRIKGKINNPPKNIDDQEVSKKFLKFIKLKNDAKDGKSKFNRKKLEIKLKKIHNLRNFS